MKIASSLFILFILFACKTPKVIQELDTDSVEKIYLTGELGKIMHDNSAFVMEKVRLEGHKLFVDINYSGGCEEHNFRVVGNPSISKSLPPVRSIQIQHDSKGDKCKKLIKKQLVIDISQFAYEHESGSQIYLVLEGYDERILFTFE